MAKKKKKDKNVVFRRINGRIVPIAVGSAGLIAARDAYKTKTIHLDKKRGIRIDKKSNVRASLSVKGGADELRIYKNGKKAGFANFSRFSGDLFNFNFLRINKKHQKKGLSKILGEETAREIKRQGGAGTVNQVIHRGSAIGNYRSKRDKFFDIDNKRISKKKALEEIEVFQEFSKSTRQVEIKGSAKRFREAYLGTRKRGSIAGIYGMVRHSIAPDYVSPKDSGVFRQTSLKGVRKMGKHSVKPFRTKANKLTIGLGAAAAIGGFYKGLRNGKESK